MKHQVLKTPYLYLNYNKLKKNIEEMAKACREQGVDLKPHCKSHKTLEIAKLQIEYGATGITTATLKETSYLIEGGLENITLAYPLISTIDLQLFSSLRPYAHLETIVLNEEHGRLLNNFFEEKEPLLVWLKVDTGLHRLGISPDEIEETLNSLIKLPNIEVIGLLTHGGHSYGGGNLEKIAWEEGTLLTSRGKEGIKISCGSTPTAREILKVPFINEIRPGNYVFYDNTMINLGVCHKEDCTLMVKSTIIGIYNDYLVIDAGSKTLGLDQGVHGNSTIKGFGYIIEDDTLSIERLSEEHGIIKGENLSPYKLGDILTIIPNHACSVVNLADELYVFEDNTLTGNYKIRGRGH